MTSGIQDSTDASTDVQLFCRASTTSASAIDRYHSRLATLESAGAIGDLEVVTWPSRVDLTTGGGDEVAEAYDRFAEWAEEENVRLGPAFDVETYESEFTGESGTALVTPVACIAAYDDGDLDVVYPHTDGDEVYTVEDGLDELYERAASETGVPGDSSSMIAGAQD